MNLPSNKSFGITFGTVFLIIFSYVFLVNKNLNIYLISISIVFFILGLMNSNLLKPLNFVWFKFGIFLGKIFSPIIMAIIFFFVVTPTGLIMRILRKDILNLKYNKDNSYWVPKKGPKSKMKNQF